MLPGRVFVSALEGGDRGWGQRYDNVEARVRYATTAPWGAKIFLFAPPAAGRPVGESRAQLIRGDAGQAFVGEMVGVDGSTDLSAHRIGPGKWSVSGLGQTFTAQQATDGYSVDSSNTPDFKGYAPITASPKFPL
jgi:hypothetical protein